MHDTKSNGYSAANPTFDQFAFDGHSIIDALLTVEEGRGGTSSLMKCSEFLDKMVAILEQLERQNPVQQHTLLKQLALFATTFRHHNGFPANSIMEQAVTDMLTKWFVSECDNLRKFRENSPLFLGSITQDDRKRAREFLLSWHELSLRESSQKRRMR